jgi:hypothetical protein
MSSESTNYLYQWKITVAVLRVFVTYITLIRHSKGTSLRWHRVILDKLRCVGAPMIDLSQDFA